MVLLTSDERQTHHRQPPPLHHHNHHHHRNHRNHSNNMMVSSVENGESRGGAGGSSSTLSNFTSLPCFNIRWGRQKQLRCVKESENDDHNEFSQSMTRSELKRRRSSSVENDDGGIQAVGEKLLLEFRRETAQMQAVFLKKSDGVSTVPPSPEADQRPWNLRTRRAVCKGPSNNNNNVAVSSERRPSASPAKVANVKSPDIHISGAVGGGGGGGGGEEGPRAKFTRGLSKQEIEEDFLAIIGTRPVRRPKKRSKIVQRQIDAITPGNWLTEITADMYKVIEQV